LAKKIGNSALTSEEYSDLIEALLIAADKGLLEVLIQYKKSISSYVNKDIYKNDLSEWLKSNPIIYAQTKFLEGLAPDQFKFGLGTIDSKSFIDDLVKQQKASIGDLLKTVGTIDSKSFIDDLVKQQKASIGDLLKNQFKFASNEILKQNIESVLGKQNKWLMDLQYAKPLVSLIDTFNLALVVRTTIKKVA